MLSLLFFEQEYLGNPIIYQVEIFTMYSQHSTLGKYVSDFFIQGLVLILSQKLSSVLDIFKTSFF